MSTREELRSFRILRRIDGWAIQYEWRRAGQEAPATATEVLRSIDALKARLVLLLKELDSVAAVLLFLGAT